MSYTTVFLFYFYFLCVNPLLVACHMDGSAGAWHDALPHIILLRWFYEAANGSNVSTRANGLWGGGAGNIFFFLQKRRESRRKGQQRWKKIVKREHGKRGEGGGGVRKGQTWWNLLFVFNYLVRLFCHPIYIKHTFRHKHIIYNA